MSTSDGTNEGPRLRSHPQETFEGINFAEINEVTSLENDEIKVLKICFNMFDVKSQGFLSSEDLMTFCVAWASGPPRRS
jgi:Ca2+-binding EF-hand superfamily protein